MSRTYLLTIVGLFAATIIAVLGYSAQLPTHQSAETTLFQEPRALPDLNLLRADTLESFGRQQLSGHWTLLYTGFLNCPDLCPTTLALLKNVEKDVASAHPDRLKIAFASIDYHRDDATAVHTYTQQFSPTIIPLVGGAYALQELTDALGFIDPPQSPQTSVGHSSAVAIIGPDARLQGLFRYPQTFAHMTNTLNRLL